MKLGYRDTPYSNITPFSAGIQLFGMKTNSQGKPDLKNSIGLYLALTLTQKKIVNFFFKKSNPALCPFTTRNLSLLRQHMSEKRGVSKILWTRGHPVVSPISVGWFWSVKLPVELFSTVQGNFWATI